MMLEFLLGMAAAAQDTRPDRAVPSERPPVLRRLEPVAGPPGRPPFFRWVEVKRRDVRTAKLQK